MNPLFIFSLPRSGSTLLQKILASNPEVSSVAEPWILLPFIYPLKQSGVYAEYSHSCVHLALQDFIEELPNGKQDYLEAVGNAVLSLYQKVATDDVRYFLDKTPRYALIAEDITKMFPNGKFIYLWRNPLAVIASMIETWGNGKWNMFRFKVDLFDGLAKLLNAYQANSDNALAIQYETFLQFPEKELGRIAKYLDLNLDIADLKNFSEVNFSGKMGDPTGVKNYTMVSIAPLEKWKTVINNPLRKIWCRRYLRWLGEERLKIMGYDLNEMLSEIDAVKLDIRLVPMDIVMSCYGVLYCFFEPFLFKQKFGKLKHGERVMFHG